MSKTVQKVFIIIGVLVLAFVIWALVFGDKGIVNSAYSAVAGVINEQYHRVAGNGNDLLPEDLKDGGSETNGTGSSDFGSAQ